MELVNQTLFNAERLVLGDREGRDLLVVVVKCTYAMGNGDGLVPADEQAPIISGDTFHGEPGLSSVRYESDLSPYKPGTDVVLLGHAYAPKGRKTGMVSVSLKAGPLKKTCAVFGERRWWSIPGTSFSDPVPFARMPLVYERSFGGRDLSPSSEAYHEQEPRNPVGCGLLARGSRLDPEEVRLPNIEDPSCLIKNQMDRPSPTGFGFVGRHWQPRLSLAGTYDRAWQEGRFPLPPLDFDDRYYNGAHSGLISPRHFQGGEPVELVNASPQGTLKFSLPGTRPKVAVISRSLEWTYPEPRLDTLIIEPDLSRVVMVWRASQTVHGGLYTVACIKVT